MNILPFLFFLTTFALLTPEETCIRFCDFFENNDRPVATLENPFVIAVSSSVTIAPLSAEYDLIGIRDSQIPRRYVDRDDEDADTSRDNECLPDDCGIAGSIFNPRVDNSHDMVVVFGYTMAVEVKLTVIDWGDWNPAGSVNTRWIVTAFNEEGEVVDEVVTVREAGPSGMYRACKPDGTLEVVVESPDGDIYRVVSKFERQQVEGGEWEENSSDPNIAIAALCYTLSDIPICVGEDLHNPASACFSNGYCVVGDVDTELTGCSCFSGYGGEFCQEESEERADCVASNELSPTESTYTTQIGGEYEDGFVTIKLNAPIEDSTDDVTHPGNFGTYTLNRFRNEDKCDYPEGNHTEWTKEFDNNTCTETYFGTTSVSNFLNCIGDESTCRNGDGQNIECDPELCTLPPCARCYPGQLLSTRGYVKSTSTGFTAKATAENCHYFELCLPWIQDVSAQIRITTIPDFEQNFVVSRVAYSCFEDLFPAQCIEDPDNTWLIEIVSRVRYPFFVKESGDDMAKLDGLDFDGVFDLKSIFNESGCGVEGEDCIQILQYAIPECGSLGTEHDYAMTGLEYDCVGPDCADLKGTLGDSLLVNVNITLEATQNECGAGFTIDGTDTLTLDMDSYLSDFESGNGVFFEGEEELGTAYFKIVGTSNIAIKEIQIIEIVATVDGVETTLETGDYTVDLGCADDDFDTTCWTTNVAQFVEVSEGLVNINFVATVQVLYQDGAKRSVGLGNEFKTAAAIRVISEKDDTTPSREIQTGSVSIMLPTFFFLVLNLLM